MPGGGCQLQQRDQIRFGSRCPDEGEGRWLSQDPRQRSRLSPAIWARCSPKLSISDVGLKLIVLGGHLFRHLKKVVADNGPREFRLRYPRIRVLRKKQTATEECQGRTGSWVACYQPLRRCCSSTAASTVPRSPELQENSTTSRSLDEIVLSHRVASARKLRVRDVP